MWKKTKVPFQRSWLTFWQNARVSRFFFFFPWDDLPVCAHPEKITQRPRSFFFYLLIIIPSSSSSSQSLFFDAKPWEFITFIVCTHSAARCKLFYGHLNWLFRPPSIHITCKLIPLSVAGREWDVGWRKTHECVKDMPLMHISGERYFFSFSFKVYTKERGTTRRLNSPFQNSCATPAMCKWGE